MSQKRDGFPVELRRGIVGIFFIRLVESSQKVNGQVLDIFLPFVKCRNVKMERVEPVIQILPEPPGFDFFQQVFVGGGDQEDLRITGLVFSEAHKRAGIQKTQQLDLRFGIGVPDFVEEHDAAVRLLQNALTVGFRPGVCAFFMAEQFAVGQVPAVGGDIGFAQRKFVLAFPVGPENFQETRINIVEEKFLELVILKIQS